MRLCPKTWGDCRNCRLWNGKHNISWKRSFRRDDGISGIDSELLDKFLSEYKKNGIEPINYKAVLTVNNIFWTPEELFAELKKEHRKFAGR